MRSDAPAGRIVLALLAISAGALALVTWTARASDSSAAATPKKPTYFANVRPILQGRCVSCHRLGGLAPFSLTSYEAARKHRESIRFMVTTRRMPPWHAEPGHRRYKYDPSLSDSQIETVRRWVAQGAPRGDKRFSGAPLTPVAGNRMRVDLRVQIPPYTPRVRPHAHVGRGHSGHDDYRCFVLSWIPDRLRFITGFEMRPGELAEVHHISVYGAPASEAATVERWEAADAAPGYDCFGGIGGPGGPEIGVQLFGGWVPGVKGANVSPPGTGLIVAPGTRMILQIHYNTDGTRPKPDRSTIEFQLADVVERPSIILLLGDVAWFQGPPYFQIPAGRKDVKHAYTYDTGPLYDAFEPDTVSAHMAFLHMHFLGASGRVSVARAIGGRDTLLSIPRWDFHWQRTYWLAKTAALRPGDNLSVECRHDNSARKQPLVGGVAQRPRDVTWGGGSADEMCIGGVYVSGRLRGAAARLSRLAVQR